MFKEMAEKVGVGLNFANEHAAINVKIEGKNVQDTNSQSTESHSSDYLPPDYGLIEPK